MATNRSKTSKATGRTGKARSTSKTNPDARRGGASRSGATAKGRASRSGSTRGGAKAAAGKTTRSAKSATPAKGKKRTTASAGRKVTGAGMPTTDHEFIRQWVEERGGHPACVRGTGGKLDTGLLRIDMPGYTGADKLAPISWDDWFEKFDEKKLALLYQDRTKGGQKSNFNKLVRR